MVHGQSLGPNSSPTLVRRPCMSPSASHIVVFSRQPNNRFILVATYQHSSMVTRSLLFWPSTAAHALSRRDCCWDDRSTPPSPCDPVRWVDFGGSDAGRCEMRSRRAINRSRLGFQCVANLRVTDIRPRIENTFQLPPRIPIARNNTTKQDIYALAHVCTYTSVTDKLPP
jgi:hypothetical protein